jgi:hypothetical protein
MAVCRRSPLTLTSVDTNFLAAVQAPVALTAGGDQVLFEIATTAAAELQVMHL